MSNAYNRRPNPFKEPPKKVLEELKEVEEAMLDEEEEWETFFTSSDRSTPSRLFDNPPERFLARLDYGESCPSFFNLLPWRINS